MNYLSVLQNRSERNTRQLRKIFTKCCRKKSSKKPFDIGFYIFFIPKAIFPTLERYTLQIQKNTFPMLKVIVSDFCMSVFRAEK